MLVVPNLKVVLHRYFQLNYIKMKLILSVLLITNTLLLPTNVSCTLMKNALHANIEYLTNNFFANLKEDPHLQDTNLSDSSKDFIDKQVANYMALIRQTHGLLEHSMTRRSLPIDDLGTLTTDYGGVYILNGFRALYNIKAQFPKDIVMFKQIVQGKEMWYAAALECKIGQKSYDLVAYALVNARFMEIFRVSVINAKRLAVYSTATRHYIVAAESSDPEKQHREETTIYEFDGNDDFRKIQALKRGYASDVVIWEEQKQVFMAIAHYMEPSSSNPKEFVYEVDTPIYKWLGRHFDVVHHIKTSGAKKITPFAIGNSHFLVVANFRNNNGNTNVYSEIFKYNLQTEQFESYQKILTNAAVDVKYFYFVKHETVKENFLVFANMYEIDSDGNENYNTDSIVYKYVDNYFIPFQSFKLTGATEWLPVSDARGEFVLLVACKFDGVKAYQYDGWKFVEAQVPYTDEAFSRGVSSMRTYRFQGKSVIVVANGNDYYGGMMNLFQPSFIHRKMLNKFQKDMLTWCRESLQSFQSVEFERITKQIEEAPKQDDSILQLGQSVAFSDVTIENLHTFEPNATDAELSLELDDIEDELNAYTKELTGIEEEMKNAMRTIDSNVFIGDVYVKRLFINSSDTVLEFLTTSTINDQDVSTISNDVININKGFKVENPIVFNSVTAQNQLFPKLVNGQSSHTLSQRIQDGLVDIIIEGNAVFKDGIIVEGKLNEIKFTKDNILLKKGDQTLGNLEVDELRTETMYADFINNIEMSQMEPQSRTNTLIENINNLNVKSIIIGGYINKVDVPTLDKYALRTFGDQILTAEYSFNSLHVENINVTQITGKKVPEDLILIRDGNYRIDHDIQFVSDLNANIIHINNGLNSINVVNGELDVLLVDADHIQHITGYKEFENVQLLNPITLQGQINSARMGKMNPVAIIEDELILTGDYVISGDVRIEQLLQTSEMLGQNSQSVQRLQEKGIKITNDVIPVHLNFAQQLNVLEVFTDKINDVEVNSLIVMDTDQPQIITGWKKFLGDVHILGPTKIDNVNGINLQDLEAGIMKIYGNQTLSGKYLFENVIANRVYNVKTEFGGNLWENVITTYGDQSIAGTTLIANNVQVNQLETNILNCKSINGNDFTSIVNDTVLHGQTTIIGGQKEFTDLRVENLDVPNLDLHQLQKQIEQSQEMFQFDEDIELPDNIVIENITFSGHFNDVPSESLGQQWLSSENEQVINSDQNFNKITILGELVITSGFMNDIRIEDITENSVKTDENFHFPAATFQNGLASINPITLDGQFESLYLDDIVQNHLTNEQIIAGPITFNGDVTVFGEVLYAGLVSGLNLTQFCKFAFPAEEEGPKNLHINGNVYFTIGPEVYLINNRPIRNILDNAWFTDREALITGSMEFSQALFQENLRVNGFIDEIKVELIAQTYFSKTRDQNVSAFLDIDENVIFASGVYAKRATVGDDVGGINLAEFMRTVFLDNYQQTFESIIYLDECQILNLQGDYKVNSLDLQTDVLRYNGENIVTGNKIIYNVHITALTLPIRELWHELRVQGVTLLNWLQTAILKNGNFKITGGVAFHNHTIFMNGISSRMSIANGRLFNNETIMLKSLPQEITGYKAFAPEMLTQPKPYPGNVSHPLKFKTMILEGNLNGVDMSDLMDNQAYKNRETVFNSPVNFNSDINTVNINMENLYQGKNVTEVVGNITRFESAKEYYDSYQTLLNISTNIQESLTDQAFYLDHYLVKEIYQEVDIVIPVEFELIQAQYLASIVKGSHNYSIHFHIWDEEGEFFREYDGIKPIESNKLLRYLKPITFKNQALWYMEHKNDFSNFDPRVASKKSMEYEGSLYKVTENNGLQHIYPSIIHSGSKSVAPLTIPEEKKDCLVAVLEETVDLLCEEVDNNGIPFLDVFQLFFISNTIEVTTALIYEIPYIFMINAGSVTETQPTVDIWKYNGTFKNFRKGQVIYVASPNSITAISFQGNHFLAVASGHVQNARHAGLLDIRQYNSDLKSFESVQQMRINAPLQVEFAVLPSKELILYILTDNPTQPLMIYEYLGISGFKEKFVASTIPKTMGIMSFTSERINKHFVLAQNDKEIRVIQAVLKGGIHNI